MESKTSSSPGKELKPSNNFTEVKDPTPSIPVNTSDKNGKIFFRIFITWWTGTVWNDLA